MMTSLLGFMLAVMLVMWWVPDSPAGKLLRRQLVERPVEWFLQFERHRLIYLVLLVGMALAGGEMIVLLGPEVIATYAIYLDAVLVSYALAAVAVARNSLRYMRLRWRRGIRVRRLVVGRRRRRRQLVRRQLPSAANDEDGPAAFPLAA